MNDVINNMRRDWDARAVEDARFYTTCQRRSVDDREYEQGAADVLGRVRRDYWYIPHVPPPQRRFLEIGCGLGRLMRALAADCAEIHGIDISAEMVERGRAELAHIAHAHFSLAQTNDLSAFADASFHLVYSFAVFQHIPDRALVFRYLEEAYRVLQPGGVFAAQFNGMPRPDQPHDTWSGVGISEEELLEYAREKEWPVLSSEGAGSQYMWLTMRKPAANDAAPREAVSATIYQAKHPDGGEELAAGGQRGFAELFVRDLPEFCSDITKLSAAVDDEKVRVCFIGPIQDGSWRQINIQVPQQVAPGSRFIKLFWHGQQISNDFAATVRSCPPPQPRIIRITDNDEHSLEDVVRSGWMQINLDGCQDAKSFRVLIGGREAEQVRFRCVELLSGYHLVSMRVPDGLTGRQQVCVSVDGRDLPPREVEIAS